MKMNIFEAEQQQIEICMLKSNLEEIEDDLVSQRLQLPALDAENDRKFRETMSTMKVVRSLHAQTETLKLENSKLTTQRVELKRQYDDIFKNLKSSHEHRDEITRALKIEHQEIDVLIRQFETVSSEMAERLRKSQRFYNEEEINCEIDTMNSIIADLEAELKKKQSHVDELRVTVDTIHPDLPGTLLNIIGKRDLERKLKSVNEKYEELVEQGKKYGITGN